MSGSVNRQPTVHDFDQDAMFPRVERAVADILQNGKVVAPADVLVRMGMLASKDLEAWRLGRVPYLECVIHRNLTRLRRLLWILGFHCHELNLVATPARYAKPGSRPATPLRFTKTGEPRLEKVYARHFVWPGKGPFRPPRQKSSDATSARDTSTARLDRPGRG